MSGKKRGAEAPARARHGRIKRAANGAPIGFEWGAIVFPSILGPRSSEADRERLAHLSATVFDYNGVAAHVAKAERFKRPMSQQDMRRARNGRSHNESMGSGSIPPGWGAPVSMLRPDLTIEAAEMKIDRDLAREPKLIEPARTPRDYALNALAGLTPLQRLAYLRELHHVRSPVSTVT